MLITIIDVAAPVYTKTQKGGYNSIEVAYKKDGKVEGKKIVDFSNREIFKQVQAMKAGTSYEITTEKDNNGFWQWTRIELAEAGEVASGGNASTTVPSGSVQASRPISGRVTGSNYETPAERARRQVLIGRQSSINYALDFLKHNNTKAQFDLDVVFKTAEAINNWVVKEDPVKAIAAMPDDIPV